MSIRNIPIAAVVHERFEHGGAVSFQEALRCIGSNVPVEITTVDGSTTPGRIVGVGNDCISVEVTVGSGPVTSRRVIARHEVRLSAVCRVSVPGE